MAKRTSKEAARTEAEHAVCDAVAGPLSAAIVSMTVALAERLQMNLSDFTCLSIVSGRGALTAGELAVLAGMSTPQVARVVNRLEEAGLIVRERDADDGRRTILKPVANPTLATELAAIFGGLTEQMAKALEPYDTAQVLQIARFLQDTSRIFDETTMRLRGR